MIIKEIKIEKFRAFVDVSFKLAKRVTAIAGRNATQKTTILGMIGAPFSITQNNHPMFGCKTIDGYDFKSQFDEKFKFSPKEQASEHQWTLNLYDNIHSQDGMIKTYYKAESILRDKRSGKLRIWNAEDKAHRAGRGFVQAPVYYLSLSRLYPIGEITGKTMAFDPPTTEENAYCLRHYREILQIMDIPDNSTIGIEAKTAKQKFAGVNNGTQDVSTNSAGEGNITRIMLAMLSFGRLKKKYGTDYKGGILLIDELDAAVYPYAQRKLVEYLFNASNEFDVQVVFTTHSATVLEALITQQNKRQKRKRTNFIEEIDDSTIIYLKPEVGIAGRIVSATNISNLRDLRILVADMNLEYLKPVPQLQAYCEDDVAVSLAEYLFDKYYKDYAYYVSVQGLDLGWSEIVRLLEIKALSIDDSLILLDADVLSENKSSAQKKALDSCENVLYLPLQVEEGLFELLRDAQNFSSFAENFSNNKTFSRDVCFAEVPMEASYYKDKSNASKTFKDWFNRVEDALGSRKILFDFWYSLNKTTADDFIRKFYSTYNKLADKLKLDPLSLPFGLSEHADE